MNINLKYIEKDISWRSSIFILLVSFIVLYNPFQLGDKELSTREGYYAAMATENVSSVPLPVTVAQGEVMFGQYPLYPALASLLDKIGVPIELNLRLISVISLFLLGLTVLVVGIQAVNRQAGIVAAAMTISSYLAVDRAIDGYPNLLTALFLFWGWMTWFTYGAVKRMWGKAWILSSVFCGLAFYTAGWLATFYFILPLVFLRRPLTIWRKLKSPSVIVAALIVIFFVLLWLIPMIMVSSSIPIRGNYFAPFTIGEYFSHIISFPFDIISEFMPWSLIMWPPFCVALFRIDNNIMFSRYLRTIVISIFCFMWLNPYYESRDLLYIAAPLSVLTGCFYWILVRRYTRQYYYIYRFISLSTVLLALAIIAFYVMPESWFDFSPYFGRGMGFKVESRLLGLIEVSVALIIALYFFLLEHRNIVLWRHIIGLTVACALLNWGFISPYKAQTKSKHRFAESLKDSLIAARDYSPDLVVYKDSNIAGLYSECYYLGCKVKRIHSLNELPKDAKTIYLLSTRTPFIPGRKTVNIIPRMLYKKTVVYLWKCVLKEEVSAHEF